MSLSRKELDRAGKRNNAALLPMAGKVGKNHGSAACRAPRPDGVSGGKAQPFRYGRPKEKAKKCLGSVACRKAVGFPHQQAAEPHGADSNSSFEFPVSIFHQGDSYATTQQT